MIRLPTFAGILTSRRGRSRSLAFTAIHEQPFPLSNSVKCATSQTALVGFPKSIPPLVLPSKPRICPHHHGCPFDHFRTACTISDKPHARHLTAIYRHPLTENFEDGDLSWPYKPLRNTNFAEVKLSMSFPLHINLSHEQHPTLTISVVRCPYLLTPWCRVLLEQLTGFQLVKKCPAFHGTLRFITALTSVRHLSLS